MKIDVSTFGGEIPRSSSRSLPNEASQKAVNCDFRKGTLAPLKEKTEVYDTSTAGLETILKWTYNLDAANGRTVTNNAHTGWTGVTDASILLTTAGNGYEISAIDFTGDTSMFNVASTIQAKIRTATGNLDTVTWDVDHFEFNFDDEPFVSMGALYGTGTDITDTGYMNVRGDIGTTQTDWVSFANFTYAFNTPIIDDQYQRLYTLDTVSGVYRVRDNDYQFTSTDREMVLDVPSSAMTVAASSIVLYNDQVESPAVYNTTQYEVVRGTPTGNSATSPSAGQMRVETITGLPSDILWAAGDIIFTTDNSGDNNGAAMTGEIVEIASVGLDDIIFNVTNEVVTGPYTNTTVHIMNNDFLGGIRHIVSPVGGQYPALEGAPRDGVIYDRSYVWTYVYTNGEEGPISGISDEIKIYPESVGILTDIGTSSPPTDVVYKNIYTTDAGTFKFVSQIAGTATTFTDNLSAVALGEELSVYQNATSNMKGVALSPQGFVMGWRDNDLYFSESFIPYAWDDRWSLNFANSIVGCIPVGGETYVLTTGAPYILTGYHPSELISSQLEINQSCANEKAITRLGEVVVYASPDGLISLQGARATLLTEKYFTRVQWQTLNPSTMILSNYNEEIYIFTDTITYIIGLKNEANRITRIDDLADAEYRDVEDDLLYIYTSSTGKIYSLNSSATDRTYTWRSKLYDFKKRSHLSCGKIIADSYADLTLKLYVDDDYSSPKFSKAITSKSAFRFPNVGSYSTFAFELVGKDVVNNIQLGTNMMELQG